MLHIIGKQNHQPLYNQLQELGLNLVIQIDVLVQVQLIFHRCFHLFNNYLTIINFFIIFIIIFQLILLKHLPLEQFRLFPILVGDNRKIFLMLEVHTNQVIDFHVFRDEIRFDISSYKLTFSF